MSGFIKIPTEILQDKKLNHTQILLYGIIMSLSKKEGYCRASNKTIGDTIGLTINAVQKNLIALKNAGRIEIKIEDYTHRKIYIGGYKKINGGVDEIIPKYNNEYLFTNVNKIPPKKNEDGTDTRVTKKRTTNEHLLVGELKDKFDTFWKAYPHYQGRSSRKDSIPLFLEYDCDELIMGAYILKWKIEAGLENQQYVKASERWLKRFTPLDERTKHSIFKEIMERHMNAGGDMRGRMERLIHDFPEVDFEKLYKERSNKRTENAIGSLIHGK